MRQRRARDGMFRFSALGFRISRKGLAPREALGVTWPQREGGIVFSKERGDSRRWNTPRCGRRSGECSPQPARGWCVPAFGSRLSAVLLEPKAPSSARCLKEAPVESVAVGFPPLGRGDLERRA